MPRCDLATCVCRGCLGGSVTRPVNELRPPFGGRWARQWVAAGVGVSRVDVSSVPGCYGLRSAGRGPSGRMSGFARRVMGRVGPPWRPP